MTRSLAQDQNQEAAQNQPVKEEGNQDHVLQSVDLAQTKEPKNPHPEVKAQNDQDLDQWIVGEIEEMSILKKSEEKTVIGVIIKNVSCPYLEYP